MDFQSTVTLPRFHKFHNATPRMANSSSDRVPVLAFLSAELIIQLASSDIFFVPVQLLRQ